MPAQQISQAVAPVVSRLAYIGIGIVLVAIVSFVLARIIGGASRPMRKAVFYISSFVGFVVVLFLVFTRS